MPDLPSTTWSTIAGTAHKSAQRLLPQRYAEDAAQDYLLRMWEKTLDDEARRPRCGSYVTKGMIFEAGNVRKKLARQQAVTLLPHIEELPDVNDVIDEVEVRLSAAALIRMIEAQLTDDKQRELFGYLRHESDGRRLAELTSRSEAWVSQQRKKLRRLVFATIAKEMRKAANEEPDPDDDPPGGGHGPRGARGPPLDRTQHRGVRDGDGRTAHPTAPKGEPDNTIRCQTVLRAGLAVLHWPGFVSDHATLHVRAYLEVVLASAGPH